MIDNITRSEQIKAELTGGTGRFPVASSSFEIPQKIVSWVLDVNDNSDSQKFMNARRFENALQDYLLGNKEVFFNIGGDKVSTHVSDKSKFRVTKVIVREVWKKINKQIQYDPVAVTIYVNDSSLNEILYRDMVKMDLLIGMKSWIDFIREKEFTFVIMKINNQEISRSDSFLYLKGLQTSDWRKITEFVKYY